MTIERLKEKIIQLTELFLEESLPNFHEYEISDINYKLKLIVSESFVAINYIVLLEEEFGIEIEDEDISLDFFENIDKIVETIDKAIRLERTQHLKM